MPGTAAMVPSWMVQFFIDVAACQPVSDLPSNSNFQPSAFSSSVSVLSVAHAVAQASSIRPHAANTAHTLMLTKPLLSRAIIVLRPAGRIQVDTSTHRRELPDAQFTFSVPNKGYEWHIRSIE